MPKANLGSEAYGHRDVVELPQIDAAALLSGPSAADHAVIDAASEVGFLTLAGFPAGIPIDAATRRQLLRVFDLPASAQRRLWRQKFEPANPNVYRGWFPLRPGGGTWKEGIDLGPDLVDPAAIVGGDPLCEPTPLPAEADLPGWRAAAAGYYRAMSAVGSAVMAAIGRGLGLPDGTFAGFDAGISTLRLIRYPRQDPADIPARRWIEADGRYLAGAPHVDSGFVTLLAQDGVAGLQARARDGRWVDVPPTPDTLVVNFGKVLELWTAGRVRATEHRVLGTGADRCSIPFFYEPKVDTVIAPIAALDGPDFAPFAYGDHLWALMTRFIEFEGMAHLRPPRHGAPT